jgi:hypothetical protein
MTRQEYADSLRLAASELMKRASEQEGYSNGPELKVVKLEVKK